jgi:sigma-B regulation protein RsbU (phosphoserine phosphatase)
MNEQQKNGRLKRWLAQIIVFMVLPVVVFFFGFNHISELHRTSRLRLAEQHIEADLLKFEAYQNTEAFLARTFREAFWQAKKADAGRVIRSYHQRLDRRFDYVLWNASGTIIDHTIKLQDYACDWSLAYQTMRNSFFIHHRDLDFSNDEIVNVRRLLGPQVVPEGLSECRDENNEKLLWNDSTGKAPLAWMCFSPECGLLVFVDRQILQEKIGLHYFSKYENQTSSDYQLGFVENKKVFCSGRIPDMDTETGKLGRHAISSGLKFETPGGIYYPRVTDENLTIFAVIDKTAFSGSFLASGQIAALLIALLLLPFAILETRSMMTGTTRRLSLSRKLGLLLLYSNGLPLAILFFIGYDYISQKQFALIDEIHAQGIRFLQNFDERFESEHALRIFKIKRAIESFKKKNAESGLSFEAYRKFSEDIAEGHANQRPFRFYLIASDSRIFGTAEMLMLYDKRFDLTSENLDEDDKKQQNEEFRITRSIASFILSSLNGVPSDEKTATEVELIAESAMQKTLVEVQHEFIAGNGRIAVWGMGTNMQSAYIDLISMSGSQKYDYLLMCTWIAGNLESSYLNRQYLNANRNIPDLQICITNDRSNIFLPGDLHREPELRNSMRAFTHKPNPTRQFIKYRNQEHLIMGLRGKNLADFMLAGLYPVDAVKTRIYQEKKALVTAGIISLLLALILGHLLSHSFIFPLQTLTAGAEAIRQRDFAMRLPNLGSDEFGDMARLFNATMVDLEELKVAGVVQEHLRPKQVPDCGCMKLFGQNYSSGDLGGDYFDYFNTTQQRFSMLIGDVSGHGVGAALIMAMAKAGIMHAQNCLDQPEMVLQKMHQLIASVSRDGTRQAMSFQYFNFSAAEGRGTYANAGGCSPLLVNKERQSVRQIDLPGPLLGVMKNPRFSSCEITIEPGEALVVYTDGILEITAGLKNTSALEEFKEMLLQCFNPDPQLFCTALMQKLQSHGGKKKHQDDISIMILVRDQN